jgi:hypothetical protein
MQNLNGWILSTLILAAPSVKKFSSQDLQHAIDRARQSISLSYQLTGAEWFPGSNVLVNREFNFALATSSFEAAALAARNRKASALETANRCRGLVPVLLFEAPDLTKIGHLPSSRSNGYAFYGLLFGDEEAVLEAILEDFSAEGISERYIYVSGKRELNGAKGWTGHRCEPVKDFLREAASHVLELKKDALQYPIKLSGSRVTCATTRHQNQPARLLFEKNHRYVILAENDSGTFISCPKQLLVPIEG